MTAFDNFSIRVPASTANLGPGFDSIGMALNRYLTLYVTPSDRWAFKGRTANLESIPEGKDNLIYRIAAWIADEYDKDLPPAEVVMESEIPLSRGFGSSATAIVAGIELANQLLALTLSPEEKTRWGSIYEGHPDNIAPSIYGGLIIGSHGDDETNIVLASTPTLDLIALIPDYELSTRESRDTLPEALTYKEAVKVSSISNVLVAAILQNNWELAGRMMMKDLFHLPYRMPHISEWQKAAEIADQLPIYGVTLSGAGPIVLFFAPKGKGKDVQLQVKNHFPDHQVDLLAVDTEGVTVTLEAVSSHL
ncbi:homoserine kinase [Salipaludibacillus sp. LMS25]|jgi:homoserine kinase|uniref:homoserine kinase n=1 Tax=Salipaludibacillus sp. LMS25 TaxID=2924031 RepID=UPI0020D1E35A|nr:homoserine kinase [Salipaludibacillus sp. LMS25]UTR16381.1 homoserine kinase [Salipaludibacillus sp. LMS25]